MWTAQQKDQGNPGLIWFFETSSWDRKPVLGIDGVAVRIHRKKLEVLLKQSVKKGHFATPTPRVQVPKNWATDS